MCKENGSFHELTQELAAVHGTIGEWGGLPQGFRVADDEPTDNQLSLEAVR